jgi:predicted transcriptional regulator
MKIRSLDILIAHKAINLSTDLSNSEKRVAGVIVDHFNKTTSQCDPGQNAIADLIGMSRRTVIRAVERLERLGFVRKVRHGGKYHRNRYEPDWETFRRVDAAWSIRRKNRRQLNGVSGMSPPEGQTSHLGGDTHVNQTCFNNQPYKTCRPGVGHDQTSIAVAPGFPKGSPNKVFEPNNQVKRTRQFGPSSTVAARDSAERRWNVDLLDRYQGEPALYGSIVDAIDSTLVSSTTDTELQRPGSGLAFLMAELAARERGFRALTAAQAKEASDG